MLQFDGSLTVLELKKKLPRWRQYFNDGFVQVFKFYINFETSPSAKDFHLLLHVIEWWWHDLSISCTRVLITTYNGSDHNNWVYIHVLAWKSAMHSFYHSYRHKDNWLEHRIFFFFESTQLFFSTFTTHILSTKYSLTTLQKNAWYKIHYHSTLQATST
jgi:hypothetical protein